MKDHLRAFLRESASALQGRNLAREYLQARILGVLQRTGAMIPLAFHGGTTLRFLYQMPRYSEDLDFALKRKEAGYDFRAYLDAVQKEFAREGYAVEVSVNDRKVVHSAWVRFRGLLFELDLSAQVEETLAVKIEVDTSPPREAGLETTVVRRYVILNLQHHDRASLLAGKLHAILDRPFIKGRDVYDLLWYLSDPGWPEPNLAMLRSALEQTGWPGEHPTEENWRELIWARLRQAEWRQVAADVSPFLEIPGEVDLLTRENLAAVLFPKSGPAEA